MNEFCQSSVHSSSTKKYEKKPTNFHKYSWCKLPTVSCAISRLLSTFQSLATKNLNFMEQFKVIILKIKLHQESILIFYSELKRKKVWQVKFCHLKKTHSINMKSHNKHHVSVLKPYLFVLVCLLIWLHWNFKVCCLYLWLLFFLKRQSSKSGCSLSTVQIIHRFL